MTNEQAIEILEKVKAVWFQQPVDRRTGLEWAECLVRVEYGDAVKAVNEIRDSGSMRPPTPGQVYLRAREIEHDRNENKERIARRREMMETPKPSAADRAKAKKMVAAALAKIAKP